MKNDDVISRKAAIDAMQDLPYGYRGMVRDIIYNLPPEKQNKICEFWDSESSFCALNRPSAQPEITEKDVKEFCRKRCWMVVTSDLYDEMVRRWSSAHPEIIRCKDCKHKYIENMVWTCPFGLPGGELFFCAYGAERKTDEIDYRKE